MKTVAHADETQPDTIENLKILIRDAESMLADVGSDAGEKVGELRERLRAALLDGRSRFQRMRISARDGLCQCNDYVRTHPYQAVGVAVGIGALVGVIVSRRHSI